LNGVIEVAVGGFVGLAVSFMVLPTRAYDLTIDSAGRVLDLMAKLLPDLFVGLTQKRGCSSQLAYSGHDRRGYRSFGRHRGRGQT